MNDYMLTDIFLWVWRLLPVVAGIVSLWVIVYVINAIWRGVRDEH
jgi:hypothetical protein